MSSAIYERLFESLVDGSRKDHSINFSIDMKILSDSSGTGKIFPATYANKVKGEQKSMPQVENRYINNEEVPVVIIDSNASCKKRIKLAVQEMADKGEIRYPNFSVLIESVGRFTPLELPHGLCDALIRDSAYGAKEKKDTPKIVETFKNIKSDDLAAYKLFYEVSPMLLATGAYASQYGSKRPFRFASSLISECIGRFVKYAHQPSTFQHPLIFSNSAPIDEFKKENIFDWAIKDKKKSAEEAAPKKGAKGGEASNINYGSVPGTIDVIKAVVVQSVRQSYDISLAQLKNVSIMPYGDNQNAVVRCLAASATILGIAKLWGDKNSQQLRQGCHLRPNSELSFHWNGEGEPETITFDAAKDLYETALDKAIKVTGFDPDRKWSLEAPKKVVELYNRQAPQGEDE